MGNPLSQYILKVLADNAEDNFHPERNPQRIIAKGEKARHLSLKISYNMMTIIVISVIALAAMVLWLTSGATLVEGWKNLSWMPVKVSP